MASAAVPTMAAFQANSEDHSHGIERAPMHTYVPTEKLSRAQQVAGPASRAYDARPSDDNATGESKVRGRLRRFSRRVKAKVHSIHNDESPDCDVEDAPTGTTLGPILAPEPSESDQGVRFDEDGPTNPAIFSVKEALSNPMDALRSIGTRKGGMEFAENVHDNEASHGASVQLVRAHEAMLAAAEAGEDEQPASDEFEALKKIRQDSYVRWTMVRHVRKVKVARLQVPPLPRRRDYVRGDASKERTDWARYGQDLLNHYAEAHAGKYISASSELPPPTTNVLSTSLERLLQTSVPAQNFVAELLAISHWEDVWMTSSYATLYFVLCCFDYVSRAGILWLTYTVLRTRFFPVTIPALREKLEHAEDEEKRARDLNELIEQQGTGGWVDALIESSGPSIQLQLEDMADFLEVLKNFQEWRDPRRTTRALVMLLCIWAMLTFTPTWVLLKGFGFGMGIAFFIISPISHRWPQYRLLLSPATWLFWKIPSHGEWAIARLQAEAAQQLAKSQSAAAEVDENRVADPSQRVSVGRYCCSYEKSEGILCLDTSGALFKTQISEKLKWRVNYDELKSMQKITGSGRDSSSEDILLVDVKDNEYLLVGVQQREEAFMQIVGYSSLQWQIVG